MSNEQSERVVAITRQFTDDDTPCVMMEIFGPAQTETMWLERYDACISAHVTYLRCNDQWWPIDDVNDLASNLIGEYALAEGDAQTLRSALNDLIKVTRVSASH